MKNRRILFLSNGHGEDTCNGEIIKALLSLDATVEMAAIPIVGEGNIYQGLGVPILTPTRTLPSGGFLYMNPWVFFQDIASGLMGLLGKQLQIIGQRARDYDILMVTGDIVVAAIAYFTKKPYIIFLSAYSSYYEGKLNLGLILPFLLKSPRCLAVFTRDQFTAEDLQKQGIKKAQFVGTPMMDNLTPKGVNLNLDSESLMIAILPGSRLQEARNNLILLLKLVEMINQISSRKIQFIVAAVASLMAELDEIALSLNWQHERGRLTNKNGLEVICYSDSFADILNRANLVIGMAGTANEQAVGLGKPVITIPGHGPAFTYRFAEAQLRLLGLSIQLIGTKPADGTILKQAAQKVNQTLQNTDYLKLCLNNGEQRMGKPGGSLQIAQFIRNPVSGNL
ncbi:MAG TPA: lipid-A-disaccharide synthase-related protein [Candidatus Obscuribacterales bacterium]